MCLNESKDDWTNFETKLEDNELKFSYQLKEGISQDRMGYLILQKEGVIDLLNNIGKNTDKNP